MIRIRTFYPPPKYFFKVRNPGEAYLKQNPNPTSRELSQHDYWREIHTDLYEKYDGVCAYCASWSPRKNDSRLNHTTIDHYIPKSIDPHSAYDWTNFRLSRCRLNQNKGEKQCVIDPVKVVDGWFQIDFTTFLISPDDSLSTTDQEAVNRTIDCLDLNSNDYVNERISVIREYSEDKCPYKDLKKKYPFIAMEMVRCEFDKNFKKQIKDYFYNKP